MLVFNDLKAFMRSLIRYVGNGYTECQISPIKRKKRKLPLLMLKQIDAKLSKKYLSTLSKGQRQYRKRKGFCNYMVLRYKTFLYVVLKTKGKDVLEERWENIHNKPLPLGDVLELVLYKDERGKNTVKISKMLFREIRASIRFAIEKKDGRRFHAELKKLHNLSKTLPYRGLNMQLSSLLRDISKWQKEHGTKFQVPKFF